MSDAQAAAEPNGPVMPGPWKPTFSAECSVAAPMRNITSMPATMAVTRSRPLAPQACAIANAGSATVAPPCTPAPGIAQIVELEGVREGAERQRRLRNVEMVAVTPGSRHGPPCAARQRFRQHHLRPGEPLAEGGAGDRVDQALLGARDRRRRDVVERSATANSANCCAAVFCARLSMALLCGRRRRLVRANAAALRPASRPKVAPDIRPVPLA